MRNLILEGVDGAGKTTIARAFERRGWKVMKFIAPPTCIVDPQEQVDFIDTLFLAAAKYMTHGYDIVFDRYYPSELVYGRLRHRPMSVNIQRIEDQIKQHTTIVYVTAPHKTLLSRCNDGDIQKRDIKKLMRYYDEFFSKTHVPWVKVDGTAKYVNDEVNKILEFNVDVDMFDEPTKNEPFNRRLK